MSETQQQNDNQTQQPAPSAPENQPQQPQAPQQQGQPQPPFGQVPQQPQQPHRTLLGICRSRAKTLKANSFRASAARPCSTSTLKTPNK